ncbi:MAG: ATP-binding cassette domain-containing protein [Ignavibacteriae bacterium]|nr:ATP-binding cassette domain-containing protein [Ignavibacteriota bacterium]
MLQIQDILFSYSKNNILLKSISITLKNNLIYALIGTNGSGKTTLFNVINGYLKPQSGDIFLNQNRITNFPVHVINKMGVGRTFQDLRLITKLSVKENIILSMQNNPTDDPAKSLLPGSVYKNEIEKLETRADSLLYDYFLDEVRDSPAGEISYGQQKLLNLACCVANDAGVLLLDEPLAGINDAYREILEDKIEKLARAGKAILMIDHHMDYIERSADEILFLQDGGIRRFMTVDEMRRDKEVNETYLV